MGLPLAANMATNEAGAWQPRGRSTPLSRPSGGVHVGRVDFGRLVARAEAGVGAAAAPAGRSAQIKVDLPLKTRGAKRMIRERSSDQPLSIALIAPR